MEIKPTYVTFEQAKLLFDKSFPRATEDTAVYILSDSSRVYSLNAIKEGLFYHAPEQHQVVEWLRVNHDIHITYDIGLTGYYGLIKYRHSKGSLYLSKWVNEQENPFKSPQEAYSAAFDYVLNNLL
jgi:hypothetical protein